MYFSLSRVCNRTNRAARRPSKPTAHRSPLALEVLEDRTVPSTTPILGSLPAVPIIGSPSAIASPITTPIAGTTPATSSPAIASAAAQPTDIASAVQALVTDLTKTLQDVITDVTDTIKIVSDAANAALPGVTDLLKTDVAD